MGDLNGSLQYTDMFFTDEHLTRTCTQQDLLAKQTHLFSTMFSANIMPYDPRAGQEHGLFYSNYRRGQPLFGPALVKLIL